MQDTFNHSLEWLRQHPELHTLVASSVLLLLAWLSNWIVRRILLKGLLRLVGGQIQDQGLIKRLANVVPALVLTAGVKVVPGLPAALVTVVTNVCAAFIILTLALAISALLDIVNSLYNRRPDAHLRPIKGYLQVLKIAVFAIAAILMVASLIDRSPLILLSGLGAMAAVLMLIFQDTLLSLVASVQITSNDIIRVGDWVEMPQLNADGDVIDIALHTVKVQNWDKTITTIPTWRLMTESFKNWRGMFQSGGRRIMRSLLVDAATVHLLTPAERQNLARIRLLDGFWSEREGLLAQDGQGGVLPPQAAVAPDMVTNLAAFKAYAYAYLQAHPGISKAPGMFMLVRTLEPTATGVPLQLFCYTATTVWVEYEGIQGDVIDHLIGVLPQFGLALYQRSSDQGSRQIAQALAHGEHA